MNLNNIQKDDTLHDIEPVFRNDVTVQLVDFMGTEDSIISAARVSNDSDANSHSEAANKGLLKALIREGHGVPFEKPTVELYLEVPIFISRQIVKTRISSVNESSGRYNNAIPEFYIPDPKARPMGQIGKTMDYKFTNLDEDTQKHVSDIMRSQSFRWWRDYADLRKIGVAKEVARMTAPVNMYSHMRVTWNLRTLLNFISLRHYNPNAAYPSHGQWEIDFLVSQQLMKIVEELWPNVWIFFKEFGWRRI